MIFFIEIKALKSIILYFLESVKMLVSHIQDSNCVFVLPTTLPCRLPHCKCCLSSILVCNWDVCFQLPTNAVPQTALQIICFSRRVIATNIGPKVAVFIKETRINRKIKLYKPWHFYFKQIQYKLCQQDLWAAVVKTKEKRVSSKSLTIELKLEFQCNNLLEFLS